MEAVGGSSSASSWSPPPPAPVGATAAVVAGVGIGKEKAGGFGEAWVAGANEKPDVEAAAGAVAAFGAKEKPELAGAVVTGEDPPPNEKAAGTLSLLFTGGNNGLLVVALVVEAVVLLLLLLADLFICCCERKQVTNLIEGISQLVRTSNVGTYAFQLSMSCFDGEFSLSSWLSRFVAVGGSVGMANVGLPLAAGAGAEEANEKDGAAVGAAAGVPPNPDKLANRLVLLGPDDDDVSAVLDFHFLSKIILNII